MKDLYRPRLETILSELTTHLPEAEYAAPEGGFFVGVDLAGMDAAQIREKALTRGLVLSDGQGFFPDRDGHSFIRLPFCALSVEEIQVGIRRLGMVVREIQANA